MRSAVQAMGRCAQLALTARDSHAAHAADDRREAHARHVRTCAAATIPLPPRPSFCSLMAWAEGSVTASKAGQCFVLVLACGSAIIWAVPRGSLGHDRVEGPADGRLRMATSFSRKSCTWSCTVAAAALAAPHAAHPAASRSPSSATQSVSFFWCRMDSRMASCSYR